MRSVLYALGSATALVGLVAAIFESYYPAVPALVLAVPAFAVLAVVARRYP
jgi:hypothetical protein